MVKGQYYAAKYRGKNGDLILGRIESVRQNGDVILENLLTGSRSTKHIDILRRRNKRVSKAEVDHVLDVWETTGSKSKTREAAVLAPEYGARQPQPEKPPDKRKQVEALAKKFVDDLMTLLEVPK